MDLEKFRKLVDAHEDWLNLRVHKLALESPEHGNKLSLSGEKIRKIELTNRQLNGATILNTDFLHSVLDGCNFSDSDLTGSRFREVSLVGVKLVNANLSSSILIKANIKDSKLTKAKLTGADLNGASLVGSSIAGADLRRASAKYTNFTNGRLNGANFENSDLSNAIFKNSNALKASFRNCILDEADFTGAKLNDVGFLGATMRLTRFDSKSQLKNLRNKLTQEQLQSVIFSDESDYKPTDQEKGSLQIILNANHITPINLSYIFVSLNASYNNLLYVTTTTDGEDEIKDNLRPYYSANEAKEDLYVRQITKGSIIIEFVTFVGGGAVILKVLGDLIPKISAEIRGFKALPSEKKKELEERSLELDVKMKELEIQERMLSIEESKKQLSTDSLATQEAIHLEYIGNNIDFSSPSKYLTFSSKEVEENSEEYIRECTYPLLNVLNKYEEMGYVIKASYKENSHNK